jgi:hypothetical protein
VTALASGAATAPARDSNCNHYPLKFLGSFRARAGNSAPHIICVYVSKRVNEREKSAKPRVFIGEIAKTGGVNGRALEAPDWWIAG